MQQPFELLYLFDNDEIFILELKRTDLSSQATKSDIYKWMLISKETSHVTVLDFISMLSDKGSQERFFKQGYLSFDSQQAVFIKEASSFQYTLRRQDFPLLSEAVILSIREKLSAV